MFAFITFMRTFTDFETNRSVHHPICPFAVIGRNVSIENVRAHFLLPITIKKITTMFH